MTSKFPPCFIQARLGSTRLPRKILYKLGEQTILETLTNRLKSQSFDVFILTSTNSIDDELVDYCKNSLCLPVFRGSESDVRSRYYGALKYFDFQSCFRVTADNPFTSITYLKEIYDFTLLSSNNLLYCTHQKEHCIEELDRSTLLLVRSSMISE